MFAIIQKGSSINKVQSPSIQPSLDIQNSLALRLSNDEVSKSPPSPYSELQWCLVVL